MFGWFGRIFDSTGISGLKFTFQPDNLHDYNVNSPITQERLSLQDFRLHFRVFRHLIYGVGHAKLHFGTILAKPEEGAS